MKVWLPVQSKEFENGKLSKSIQNKLFDLDTSLASELRWEAKFPEQASKEDLFTYTQRIQKSTELTAPVILSKMKAIYCWFDTDISFVDFVKLFDLSDKAYTESLINQIQNVWKTVQEGSAEKNF